ncbi:ATP-binding protein [Micromonospora sp. M42]|uniref:ATP-binding protein n=1 Tax=Micromonospora sp. M42 TaxID=457406 RepID=UPI00350F5346
MARHAPGATASLRLAREGGAVVVEVVDDGPGFDPATVPAHRYGLRESIHGRMTTVGGRALVTSAPGAGTRIRLEWSDAD